ncbi:hypothetical protein [Aquisphaera insulae]|uniref:hypothetical protein n=1 Tax=Aquisphaera insulae TaxID=2712864 RepID=UPI0013E9C836|nr:hypothetical protein [Aquisphaera insulae]
MPFLALLLAILTATPGDSPSRPAWRFITPPPSDAFEHPPWRAVSLSPARPEDVAEKVSYRGSHRRYTQLRYGSPGSTRVTVVVDEIGPGPGDVDLYVDADRNRRIEARDRVEGHGRSWRLPLGVAITEEDSIREIPREVVLKLGATGRILSVAAAGYLEGTVEIAGRTHAARRTDGDTDGFFTSPMDPIWIDLNDDGQWDPSSEQFLFTPILSIGPDRYAVRSDPAGSRLSFAPLEGTGTIRLTVRRPETRAHLAEIHAQLIGRDGSAINVDGGADAVVPVGAYRLTAFTLVLTDPAGGPAWHYGFSERAFEPGEPRHAVGKGASVEIDPLDGLALSAEIAEPPSERKSGRPITVLPRLTTADGLQINYGCRGSITSPSADDLTTTRVTLVSSRDARTLDAATSGFT